MKNTTQSQNKWNLLMLKNSSTLGGSLKYKK